MTSRVVITADDFGLHPAINAGTLEAHERGVVTSASLSPCGEAFHDAVDRWHTRPTLDIGVHLTLIGERPLCRAADVASLVGEDGRFVQSPVAFARKWFRGRVRLDEARRELETQIERVLAAGLTPTHLDTHQNLHCLPGIWALVVALAARYGIRHVRRPGFDLSAGTRSAATVLSRAAANVLMSAGRETSDGVVAVRVKGLSMGGRMTASYLVQALDRLGPGFTEIVVHPGIDNGVLYARYPRWRHFDWEGDLRAVTDARVIERCRRDDVALTSFREAAAGAGDPAPARTWSAPAKTTGGLEFCVVCGERDLEQGVLGNLARCRGCAHVFYPGAVGSALPDLYDRGYFERDEYLDYESQRATFAKNFRRYLGLMRGFGAARGRLLEIGAAYGFFLSEAREAFAVEGIDISEAAARHARERLHVPVASGDFLESTSKGPYDVVCMWDTVEHLVRPDAYLAKAAEALEPQGKLFLTTGDIDSVVARMRGRHWRQIHPPTHVHYFSPATMRRLLERAGFRVLDIRKVGVYRNLDNVLHGIRLFGKQPLVRAIAQLLARTPWTRRSTVDMYLNIFDIMFVAAEKR